MLKGRFLRQPGRVLSASMSLNTSAGSNDEKPGAMSNEEGSESINVDPTLQDLFTRLADQTCVNWKVCMYLMVIHFLTSFSIPVRKDL